MQTRRSLLVLLSLATFPLMLPAQAPAPPGSLVDIGGGQRMHLHCTGAGSPTVVFEGGAGDFSMIWSAVQRGVSGFTRACSYDRAGFAWSDPGASPRTFAQQALELRTVLQRGNITGPYVLVGQSFGAALVRGFANRYPVEVAGMVLVDAIHEDGYVFWGGQAHHLRADAKGALEPPPRIAIDTALLREARSRQAAAPETLGPPLDKMPAAAQRLWQWAAAQPVFSLAQPMEMAWSPDEAERTYQRRRSNPAELGSIPLVVLARARGNFASGMQMTPDSLERLRRFHQADLARLSSKGVLRFAPHAGHNIHLEDPGFVVQAIRDVVDQLRQ
jgi:pimeloyl-ACP methyl ester carboxylesterase